MCNSLFRIFRGPRIVVFTLHRGGDRWDCRDIAVGMKIAGAKSVSVMEDLGLQMNRNSTLGSYLQRLIWVLTGHYGRSGTQNASVPFLSLAQASKGESGVAKRGKRTERRSPVANAKIIIGLVPCNVIPEEILTDHPKRYRAMLVHSGLSLIHISEPTRH